MANEITVIKNRTHTFQASLTSGGSAWNISTATEYEFTVKENIDSTSNEFQLTKTGGGIVNDDDGSDGVINITIDNSKTSSSTPGTFIWGLDVTIGGETYQVMTGVLTIEKSVAG